MNAVGISMIALVSIVPLSLFILYKGKKYLPSARAREPILPRYTTTDTHARLALGRSAPAPRIGGANSVNTGANSRGTAKLKKPRPAVQPGPSVVKGRSDGFEMTPMYPHSSRDRVGGGAGDKEAVANASRKYRSPPLPPAVGVEFGPTAGFSASLASRREPRSPPRALRSGGDPFAERYEVPRELGREGSKRKDEAPRYQSREVTEKTEMTGKLETQRHGHRESVPRHSRREPTIPAPAAVVQRRGHDHWTKPTSSPKDGIRRDVPPKASSSRYREPASRPQAYQSPYMEDVEDAEDEPEILTPSHISPSQYPWPPPQPRNHQEEGTFRDEKGVNVRRGGIFPRSPEPSLVTTVLTEDPFLMQSLEQRRREERMRRARDRAEAGKL